MPAHSVPANSWTRRSFLSATAAAAGTAIFWTPEARAAMPMPPASPDGSLASNLDAYIAAYMQAMNAPGMTLALTSRTATLRTAGYGFANVDLREPVTTDHLFQIGSITKSFVAILILQLREEGKLDLNKPVLDYLPGLPIVTEFGAVTIHHLLTHSSGLPDNLALFSADPAARLIQGFTPGMHFHYCNAGFDILGLLIAKLDNRPWRIAVTERILKPLGMNATTPVINTTSRDRAAQGYEPYWDNEAYFRHARLAPAPNLVMDDTAGCISSTPGDMALYARMLLNRGKISETGPHSRILSEESFTLFSTPHIKAEEFSPTASYGYGIAVDTLEGHKILRHTGGMVAFASSIHVDLDGGVASFASINAMQGYRPTAVTEYAVRLLRAQAENKPLPAQPVLADPNSIDNAADYAGTFAAPDGRKLTFVVDGKSLSLIQNRGKIPLQRAGGDAFISTVEHAWTRNAFVFGRKPTEQNGAKEAPPQPVIEVSYGPDWYTSADYSGPRQFPQPPEASVYAGFYRSDSPWGGGSGVYVLKGRLVLDGTPLTPIGGSLFRVGEEDWSPITAEFLHIFEGKARLMRLAGSDNWRLEVD